ncbi:unnamed protein product, partial [Ceratitis capitata]
MNAHILLFSSNALLPLFLINSYPFITCCITKTEIDIRCKASHSCLVLSLLEYIAVYAKHIQCTLATLAYDKGEANFDGELPSFEFKEQNDLPSSGFVKNLSGVNLACSCHNCFNGGTKVATTPLCHAASPKYMHHDIRAYNVCAKHSTQLHPLSTSSLHYGGLNEMLHHAFAVYEYIAASVLCDSD